MLIDASEAAYDSASRRHAFAEAGIGAYSILDREAIPEPARLDESLAPADMPLFQPY